jgi:tetratricopeptide (TPR) repeat protein
MKFCPFIGVACKSDECELFDKTSSACSFIVLAEGIKTLGDAVSNFKREEEKSLLQEISGTLKPLVTTLQTSEQFDRSVEALLKDISTTAEAIQSEVSHLRSETGEKLFSALSTVLETVNENVVQVEKCYRETSQFLSELKLRAEEEASRRRHEEAQEHNDRGVALFYTGSQEAAKIEFEKAIELDPDLAEAYNNLALTLSELDLNDDAVENFKKAYTINPNLFEAYSNLALIHFRKGDLDEAIELMKEATKKPHSNSIAHLNLGNGLLQLGRHEDALRAWERVVKIDPSNEDAKEKIALYREGRLSGHTEQDQTEE